MEGEREKRQRPVQGRVGVKAKGALAELAALRKSGGKRVTNFELVEEEPVYDVVDEEQYAQIVKKRRDQAGGFVIDRDGLGYADIGEEEDWNAGHSDADSPSPPAQATGSKAARGKQGKSAAGLAPAAQRARMQKMFAVAAAKPKQASKPAPAEAGTDSILEGILSEVAAAGEPAPSTAPRNGFSRVLQTPTGIHSRPQPVPAVSVKQEPEESALLDRDQDISRPSAVEAELATEDMDTPEAGVPSPDCKQYSGVMTTPLKQEETEPEPAMPHSPAAALTTPVPGSSAAAGNVGGATPRPPTSTWKTPAAPIPVPPATPDTVSAAGGWQSMCAGPQPVSTETGTQEPEASDRLASGVEGELPLSEDGSLPFYMLDAHEEPAQAASLFLFGKVPASEPGKYVSCCAIVRGLQRNIFFVPREEIASPEIAALEEEAQTDPIAARKKLLPLVHEALASVKEEVRGLLQSHGVQSMTMKPVVRRYAFENRAVRHGRQWVLKVRYDARQPALPVGLSGSTFSAAFGANQSLLEAVTLKRRLAGPGWLTLRGPVRVRSGAQLSWCGVEVEVQGHKAVTVDGASTRSAPPLTLAALRLQTVSAPGSSTTEIVAASVVYQRDTDVEAADAQHAWRDPCRLRHFSAVSRLGGAPFPSGFEAEVRALNASPDGRRNGGAALAVQPGERALLSWLVARLRALDVDVLLGHNVAAYDLSILLARLAHHKIPHWSGLGRLKRSKFPSLSGGGHQYGGGASPGLQSVLAGRLLCDTYLASRDLVREVDYTLSTLARSLLGESRGELTAADVPGRFTSADRLLGLVRATESDAWLALGLAAQLSVLPLTRALASLSGSSWTRSLAGQRAQRIESLLLHEFYNRKFLLPDRLTNRDRERLEAEQRGAEPGVEGPKSGKSKGPQYAGGLVLEPKSGLYDQYILLLDFNSLYPSIIQEYNICFTTVERPTDGSAPALPPPTEEPAVLPKVLQTLVQRRRAVKDLLKTERDSVRRAQLDIRQQALKLTANSMYGCLGFSASRFYARPLAELVTAQGREVLQSTVDLVQTGMGAEVIYGDTDSIMINSHTTDYEAVVRMGHAIRKEVNKRYRLLEIGMDGVYKRMLLLKKKKYAAIKVEPGRPGEPLVEIVEQKGLDIVRRDWCSLAKDVGNAALSEILSGKPREEVVMAIHAHLEDVKTKVCSGAVPLNKYVITKQLTKQPSDYPDAKNQPHVQVALRWLAAGRRDGIAAGETVPYIICDQVQPKLEPGADSSTVLDLVGDKSLAERAYHPQEISAPGSGLIPSQHYYLSAQVLPVVTRLCAPIEGTDPGRLAVCLGMDPSRYRGAAGTAAAGGADPATKEDVLLGAGALLDDDDRFKACAEVKLVGNNGTAFTLAPVRKLLGPASTVACSTALLPPDGFGQAADGSGGVVPLTPAQLANQITLAARAAVTRYYEGWMVSDDPLVPGRTRNLALRRLAEEGPPGSASADPRCSGVMRREMPEATLYTELCHIHRCVDVEGALATMDKEQATAAVDKVQPIRLALDAAAAAAAVFKTNCAHRWVKLDDIFGALAVSEAS